MTQYEIPYASLLPSQLLLGSPFQPGSTVLPQFPTFMPSSPLVSTTHGSPTGFTPLIGGGSMGYSFEPVGRGHGHGHGHGTGTGTGTEGGTEKGSNFNGNASQDANGQASQNYAYACAPGAGPVDMASRGAYYYATATPTMEFQSRTIYLGNIPSDTTAEELLNHVRSGIVETLRMVPEKSCAFISFLNHASATHFFADAQLKKLSIRGVELRIGWGRSSPLPTPLSLALTHDGASRNVYLGDLPKSMGEDDIRRAVERFGPIDCIKLIKEKRIAFVHFLSIGIAVKCVTQLPTQKGWTPESGRKVNYGKDRCAYISKTQAQNAAQYLGLGMVDSETNTSKKKTKRDGQKARDGGATDEYHTTDVDTGYGTHVAKDEGPAGRQTSRPAGERAQDQLAQHSDKPATDEPTHTNKRNPRAGETETEGEGEGDWQSTQANQFAPEVQPGVQAQTVHASANAHAQTVQAQTAHAQTAHVQAQTQEYLMLHSAAAVAVATLTGGGPSNIGNRTIFLGNIHPDVSTEDICNSVRGGLVQKVKHIKDKHICFITFVDAGAAAQFYATAHYMGLSISARRLKVGWGKHSGPLHHGIALAVTAGATRNVYIGNIGGGAGASRRWPESKLRQDFEEYGEVEQINFLAEKSCAFVNFTDITCAIKAIEGMRENPDYKDFKVNFGKDRCANPPRLKPEVITEILRDYYEQLQEMGVAAFQQQTQHQQHQHQHQHHHNHDPLASAAYWPGSVVYGPPMEMTGMAGLNICTDGAPIDSRSNEPDTIRQQQQQSQTEKDTAPQQQQQQQQSQMEKDSSQPPPDQPQVEQDGSLPASQTQEHSIQDANQEHEHTSEARTSDDEGSSSVTLSNDESETKDTSKKQAGETKGGATQVYGLAIETETY